ncbi:hypothetical protein [Janthinobacterium sp. YR213]|uniref:hypothetical protein n=1 Tax=Janthinobacterium sp. YR213 TaxID=1881027 RepID=UPI00088345F0|nr:hypothetical protein [Janthinobacterium sp. YR213]SDG76936.1 hypothetical protein SAMN05428968_0803 [Janthinobacterium sp. YR213]
MNTRDSTLARFALLEKALRGEKSIPASLRHACRSQGKLARLSLPNLGIEPMSLNTLKNQADVAIESGGWEKLDEMRQSYLHAIEGSAPSSEKPLSATEQLKTAIARLEESLAIERRYRLRLQTSYAALIRRMRISAESDQDLAIFLNRHLAAFSLKTLSIASRTDDDAP